MDTLSNRQPKGSKQNPKSLIKHCTRSFFFGIKFVLGRRRGSRGRHSTPTQHRAMKHLRGPRIHNHKSRNKKLKNEIYVWKSCKNLSTGRASLSFPTLPTAICCVSFHQRAALRATSSLSLCSFSNRFAFKTAFPPSGAMIIITLRKLLSL